MSVSPTSNNNSRSTCSFQTEKNIEWKRKWKNFIYTPQQTSTIKTSRHVTPTEKGDENRTLKTNIRSFYFHGVLFSNLVKRMLSGCDNSNFNFCFYYTRQDIRIALDKYKKIILHFTDKNKTSLFKDRDPNKNSSLGNVKQNWGGGGGRF